jgi:hypothetical protein
VVPGNPYLFPRERNSNATPAIRIYNDKYGVIPFGNSITICRTDIISNIKEDHKVS